MLKAIVADLNTVEEAHRGLYVEKDGKFLLNVTPTDGFALENIEGLKSANGALRREKGDLETTLRNFEGIDPAKARAALKDAAKFASFDPDKEADKLADAKFAAREAQLVGKHDEAVRGKDEVIARREKQVRALLVGNAIKGGLAPLNPLDGASDAIELLAAQAIRVREVDGEFVAEVVDDKGNPRIKDVHGSLMGVDDYLKELREKRPFLFKPDDTRGLGLTPGGGGAAGGPSAGNPWAKGQENITQQMTLENTNPTLAARYKREAGVA